MLPVGSLKPNDWGLFDLLGNSQEWTQDRGGYYVPGRAGKPSEDREGLEEITDRYMGVLRGGSFINRHVLVRSAFRNTAATTNWGSFIGFRPARTVR
jgi:formylglycine-generating enzyme required for sulfatase activity